MHARESIIQSCRRAELVTDALAHSLVLTLARLCLFSHNVYIAAESQPQLHTASSHIGAKAYCITAKHLSLSSVSPNTSKRTKKQLPQCHHHQFTC